MAHRQHLTIVSTRFPLLVLGVLLANKGRKVLIIDTLPALPEPDAARAEGYRFRRRPVPLFGLDDHGLLRRLLDEIGIGRMLINRTYPPNRISYQVVLPANRVNLYPEREKLLQELAREFPGRIDSLRRIYAGLDEAAGKWQAGQSNLEEMERGWVNPRGLFNLMKDLVRAKRLKDPTRELEPGPERDFFEIQNAFLGASAPGSGMPPLSAALIQNIGRRGTFRDPAGDQCLRALLIQRFQEYGGKIIDGAHITGVETPSNDSLELLVSDGSRVRTLLLAATEGIASGIPGIPPRTNPSPGLDRNGRYPLRFFIGLDERFVPAGMGDNLFMMREDEGGPLKLRSLYLALSPKGSDEAPEGKRALTVTALVTEREMTTLSPKLGQEVREDLLQALETVIPFLSEGLDFISTDFDPVRGYRIPSPVGTGLTSLSPRTIGRPAVRTALKGKVILLSPAQWELGLEGEALTALSAARVLRKALGREI